VEVQEVLWDKGGSQPVEDYTFFSRDGSANHHLEKGFFMHKGIISAGKRVEFISDMMLYVTVRGRWCDIVLNVHALCEAKSNDMKDIFYEELEHVFAQFPKYRMKSLLGDFNANEGREDIFKPSVGNKSPREICNDNGVTVVYFGTSKNLSRIQCSHIILSINILGLLLMGKHTAKLIMS
jgi:hypothetical protein